MSQHTALLGLPDALRAYGLNVKVMDGWEAGQCDPDSLSHYLWTDPDTGRGSHDQDPSGYMPHHTGSSRATPPPVATSKANAWIGLLRPDGRLYQTGDGIPTIYLCTAGPARISSGYGYAPAAWNHTFKGIRAPWRAQGPDGGTALNRFVFNAETVHLGDGSDIDPDVHDHVVGLGVVLHQIFDWWEATLGHLSWTIRKPDPNWSVGLPNDGQRCIIDIQDRIAAVLGGTDMWINDWTDRFWMTVFDDTDIPDVHGDGRYYCHNDDTYDFQAETGVPWGDGRDDGGADREPGARVNAINHVFGGLALAVGAKTEGAS